MNKRKFMTMCLAGFLMISSFGCIEPTQKYLTGTIQTRTHTYEISVWDGYVHYSTETDWETGESTYTLWKADGTKRVIEDVIHDDLSWSER